MPSISSDDKPINTKQTHYIKVKFEQEVVVPAEAFGYTDECTDNYVEAKNAKEAIDIFQKYGESKNLKYDLYDYINFDCDDCKWKITFTDYKEK